MTETQLPSLVAGERYAGLHRTPNRELMAAMLAVPAIVQARKAFARLSAYQPDLTTAAEVEAFTRAAADELAGTGTLAPDTVTKAADLATAHARDALIEQVRHHAASATANRLDGALEQHLGAVQQHLHAQLLDVVDQARAVVEDLGGITDADAAIDAGKTEAWQAYRQLVLRHVQLRSAQEQLLVRIPPANFVLNEGSIQGQALFWIQNPADIYPHHHRAPRGGWVPGASVDAEPTHVLPPWPDQWGTEEGLRWLLNHPDARPWIPTTRQFEEALREDGILRARADQRPQPERRQARKAGAR